MHVDSDGAAEAFALGAGAEGGVETEESRRRGADVEIAGSAMPTRGVVIDASGGGIDDGEAVVAEAEGGFDGFVEAWGGSASLEIHAVLDNEDFGGEFFKRGRLVGTEGYSVEPYAEVALASEKFKKVGGFRFFRDLDWEGDEEGFSRMGGEDLAED